MHNIQPNIVTFIPSLNRVALVAVVIIIVVVVVVVVVVVKFNAIFQHKIDYTSRPV